MNGSSHVTCKDGLYNGSAPNCLPKGKVDQSLIFFLQLFSFTACIKNCYVDFNCVLLPP